MSDVFDLPVKDRIYDSADVIGDPADVIEQIEDVYLLGCWFSHVNCHDPLQGWTDWIESVLILVGIDWDWSIDLGGCSEGYIGMTGGFGFEPRLTWAWNGAQQMKNITTTETGNG